METFKASNGVEVRISPDASGEIYLIGKGGEIEGGSRRWTVATGNSAGIDALREFFQHERDQELGRWRWPENPEYVVHLSASGKMVRVVEEFTGQSDMFTRSESESDALYAEVARAYFAAHPEPKPWHEAKHGELWALQIKDCHEPEVYRFAQDTTCADSCVFRPVSNPRRVFFERQAALITAGRRIWPEVSDA